MGHQLRVRWSEVDAQGVVYNANYLTYADIAVNEHWRSVGVLSQLADELRQIFVVDARLTFRTSARFDDLVDFRVTTGRLGRSSHSVQIDMTCQDRSLCTVVLTYVRAVDGRSVPLSDDYRRLVQAADAEPSP